MGGLGASSSGAAAAAAAGGGGGLAGCSALRLRSAAAGAGAAAADPTCLASDSNTGFASGGAGAALGGSGCGKRHLRPRCEIECGLISGGDVYYASMCVMKRCVPCRCPQGSTGTACCRRHSFGPSGTCVVFCFLGKQKCEKSSKPIITTNLFNVKLTDKIFFEKIKARRHNTSPRPPGHSGW